MNTDDQQTSDEDVAMEGEYLEYHISWARERTTSRSWERRKVKKSPKLNNVQKKHKIYREHKTSTFQGDMVVYLHVKKWTMWKI